MQESARLTGPPPSFLNPPVVEVVCGLQFAPIAEWLTAHYGLFWNRIKDHYSRSEDQSPLGKLNLGDFFQPEEVEVGVLPPLRRVFFVDSSNSYLMQIQQNRFLHNWRKLDDGDYPRFQAAYGRFTSQWDEFKSFLQLAGLPVPRLEAYELTYVNVISGPDMTFPQDIWQFLNFYREFPETASGAPPRVLNLVVGWPLDGGIGKLSLTVKHGKRQGPTSQMDFLLAEFSAKGPASADGSDMDSWFRAAHDAIVYTFAALTTERAHRLWKRVE